MRSQTISSSGFFLLLALAVSSCKHDPINPLDPTDPGDPTNPVDPSTGGNTCDPDTVYFQNTILPLLVSNCTESGCHNAQDREKDVILTSYQNILSTVKDVTKNDWKKNMLIEVLEESDSDKRMPFNKPALSTAQINLIKTWINQGARNNACNENAGGCDVAGGSKYAAFVRPLIQSKCNGCHSGTNPQGGIKLGTYAEIKTLALNGRLYAAVSRSSNWMPKGGAKLDDCSLEKLKTWIDSGALEN